MSDLSKGPLIPGSTNFTTNFTRYLKGSEIEATTVTVPYDTGESILTGGILSGIKDPVLPQDAATRAYADANAGGGAPGLPFTAVQFNNSGSFGGSASLVFDKSTTTLTTSSITDGTITFTGGRISNLTNPVLPQDAATKSYVDSLFAITETSDATAGSITYDATSMINGVISRDPGSGTVVDTTASAADLVAAVTEPQVGMTFDFTVKNISSEYTSQLSIVAGTGVTIDFDTTIYKDYVYTAKIIFENITPTTEAVKIIIATNAFVGNDAFSWKLLCTALSIDTVRLTDYNPQKLLIDQTGGADTTIDYTYTSIDLESGLFRRAPGSPSSDIFDTFENIIGSNDPVTSNNPQFWETGGVEFFIVNEGTANITLVPANSWTMDTNSNMTIFPGQTGWFIIYMDVDYYTPASSTGSIYTIGIFDTN